MLNNGSWDGKQLLDPSWVANAPRPARAWNGCGNYANFWWRKPIDGVPEDAYWAWGGGGATGGGWRWCGLGGGAD